MFPKYRWWNHFCNMINFRVWVAKSTPNISYCSFCCHSPKSDNLSNIFFAILFCHVFNHFTATMISAAMASPFTNLEAPSIEP